MAGLDDWVGSGICSEATVTLNDFFPPPPIPPPRKRRPPKAKRRKSEATIQLELVHWLFKHNVLVAITDAGILHKHGIEFKCGIPKGWPDLTCCLPSGRFMGIEVKSTKGRQSPEQIQYQLAIEHLGGVYLLVRSVEELVAQLRKKNTGIEI